jgi:Holliday junction resolvasome RuvABC endonuclease subunit
LADRQARGLRVLGIDPGAGGAIALIDPSLDVLLIKDMPIATVRERREISEVWLADIIRRFDPEEAWLERVHAYPRQGVTSAFTFGMAYGLVRGVLATLKVPTHLVTPNEWKRRLRLPADKHAARVMAARLFPNDAKLFSRSRDDGRAEAALLAHFGLYANGSAKEDL